MGEGNELGKKKGEKRDEEKEEKERWVDKADREKDR